MQDTNDKSVIPLHRYSKDRHEMNTIELTSLSRDSLDKPSLDSSSSSSPSSPSPSSSSSSSPLEEEAEGLLYDARELEAQQQQLEPAPEHLTSTRKKIIFVALYFFLNLTLTLTNKSVLNHLSLPWLLTTSHTMSTTICSFILMGCGYITLTPLDLRSHLTLLAFSLLFTLNIAISNLSLSMVSVPFHQVMRSTCPVVTIIIYRTVYSRSYSTATYLSIIPLVIGAGLATFGDYQASLLGVMLTILGVLLACIKTVATNRLMTGALKLSAMELLLRLSPLAAIQCMAWAYFMGELESLRRFSQLEGGFSISFALLILANGLMAFALNVVSFQTNKIVGALAVTVCGNVKQALTILLGIVLFNVPIGLMNAVGMVITMIGAAWFSKVELDSKKARMQAGA